MTSRRQRLAILSPCSDFCFWQRLAIPHTYSDFFLFLQRLAIPPTHPDCAAKESAHSL
jgi:hypothetical protein